MSDNPRYVIVSERLANAYRIGGELVRRHVCTVEDIVCLAPFGAAAPYGIAVHAHDHVVGEPGLEELRIRKIASLAEVQRLRFNDDRMATDRLSVARHATHAVFGVSGSDGDQWRTYLRFRRLNPHAEPLFVHRFRSYDAGNDLYNRPDFYTCVAKEQTGAHLRWNLDRGCGHFYRAGPTAENAIFDLSPKIALAMAWISEIEDSVTTLTIDHLRDVERFYGDPGWRVFLKACGFVQPPGFFELRGRLSRSARNILGRLPDALLPRDFQKAFLRWATLEPLGPKTEMNAFLADYIKRWNEWDGGL